MPAPRMSSEHMLRYYQAVAKHGEIGKAAAEMVEPYVTVAKNYKRAVIELGLPEIRTSMKATAAIYGGARAYGGEADNALATDIDIQDGVIVAFGDAHWRSLKQSRSLAHEALLRVIPHLRPTHLLAMGDMLDLAAIGRHGPVMWEERPTVMEEIGAAQTHLAEIGALAPTAERYWVRGNHDDRFDKFLAANAAAFDGMAGTRLDDHFADWDLVWRLDISGVLVVTHAMRNGMLAGRNNTLHGGVSTLTGHTHQLTVSPMQDYNGRRWGIESGTLSDPNWPQFTYCLGQTNKAAPGFVVLTFRGGRLLQPETAEVVDGVCWFRGEPLAGHWRTRRRAGSIAA
jgi:NAD(P)-dependent dehydrogenase (short-subunit alcohol dehydrogenase family)